MKQKTILLILFLFVFGIFFIGSQETTLIDATYKIGASEIDRRIELEKAQGNPESLNREALLLEAEEFDGRAVFDMQGMLKAYKEGDLEDQYLYRINGLVLEIDEYEKGEWTQAGVFSKDMKQLTAKNGMIFDLLE